MFLKNLWNKIDKFFWGDMEKEYIEKFIMPLYNKGLEAGIPKEILDDFVETSISEANYPHPLPSNLLRSKIDNYLSQ